MVYEALLHSCALWHAEELDNKSEFVRWIWSHRQYTDKCIKYFLKPLISCISGCVPLHFFPFAKAVMFDRGLRLLPKHHLEVFKAAHSLWGILTAALHWDQIKSTIRRWLSIKVNVALSCLNRMGWQCKELTAWSQQMMLYNIVQTWKCGQLKDSPTRSWDFTCATNLPNSVRADS